VKRNPQARLCNNSKCFTMWAWDTILLFTGSETIILPHQNKTILSCVRGSVTNNNGFWIGWLDLLEPLLQLQPIITVHSRWPPKTRSIPDWSVFSSCYDKRRTKDPSFKWSELTRLQFRGEPNISHHILQFLSNSVLLSLFIATGVCLPNCCPAMEFRFGSTIPVFRRHVATFSKAA
jgi:hypothetical protein